MNSFDQIRDAFPNGKMVGGDWETLCGVHADTGKGAANLHIRVENGKVLAHCNAGCDQGAVFKLVSERLNLRTPGENSRLEPEQPNHAFEWDRDRIERAKTALRSEKIGLEFLAARGISPEIIELHQFGWETGRIVIPTFVEGKLAAVKLRALTFSEKSQKWRKSNRDRGKYWLYNRQAAVMADEFYLTESELDAAMLCSHGFSAGSLDSAGHQLNAEDKALLNSVGRLVIASDTDEPGQNRAKAIEAEIPAIKRVRIVPHGVKDLGELYAEAPEKFVKRLARLVRAASTTRSVFSWDDLLREKEIVDRQGAELRYLVEGLIPAQRITMLFGPEKSCKSLLSFYIGKCTANGQRVFGNYDVVKAPALYLDAEDGILGEYLSWMHVIGPEEVRFRTLATGIPTLEDASLLQICREQKPLLIIDSLHKFVGREAQGKANAWRSTDLEPILEKIRGLCVAGATVILIHHSLKSDQETYRDSSVIGAGVDFLYAVVGEEPVNGLKRVRVIGKPSRGAQPPSLGLIAFPALIERGAFDVEANPPKTDVERVVEFIERNGRASKRDVRNGIKGISHVKKDLALEKAVENGLLKIDVKGFYVAENKSAPCRARSELDFCVPDAGHSPGTAECEAAEPS